MCLLSGLKYGTLIIVCLCRGQLLAVFPVGGGCWHRLLIAGETVAPDAHGCLLNNSKTQSKPMICKTSVHGVNQAAESSDWRHLKSVGNFNALTRFAFVMRLCDFPSMNYGCCFCAREC